MNFENKKLKEFKEYIKFKNVAIVGLGVSNIPLIDFFYNQKSKVTILDEREEDKISEDIIKKIKNYSMKYFFGKKYLSNLKGFDVIVRSPSCLPTVKELKEEEKRGALVTTEIELFMKMCPCKIIGITGSDGKTTTTTLISEIIKNSNKKCYVGGNIGIPLFTKVNEIMPEDIAVLELSSFQLMEMEISPDIAVITNITPNHLNVHKNYEEYIEAKTNIFKYQNKDGVVILNYDNKITRECASIANGKVIFFSSKEKLNDGYIVDGDTIKKCDDGVRKHLLNTEDLIIRGNHNFENICSSLAAVKGIVDEERAINTIKHFKGVEHRIEFVREIDEIKWYNDSASTTPTRLISALNSFKKEQIILIAGGADKNLDYHPVAKPILNKVTTLILMGQTSEKIFNCVKEEEEKTNKNIKIYLAKDLLQAINIAKEQAKTEQVVLFSPASTSFDMFKNMYDRGDQFKKIVNNL